MRLHDLDRDDSGNACADTRRFSEVKMRRCQAKAWVNGLALQDTNGLYS